MILASSIWDWSTDTKVYGGGVINCLKTFGSAIGSGEYWCNVRVSTLGDDVASSGAMMGIYPILPNWFDKMTSVLHTELSATKLGVVVDGGSVIWQ